MLKAWNVILACGNELHGRDYGSYAMIKHRNDIIDLYVNTGAGKVFAPKHQGRPGRFDFYVHVAMEEDRTERIWKLITKYQDHWLVRYVLPDGRNWTERINI